MRGVGAESTGLAAPAPQADRLPRRPMLAPGVRVTRRDDAHLQIGIDAPSRVIAADQPAVRELVTGLLTGLPAPPRSAAAERCLDALVSHRLVVDGDALLAALAVDDADHPVRAGALAAAYTQGGPDAPRRLRRRAGGAVAVDAVSPWDGVCRELLAAAGVPALPAGPVEGGPVEGGPVEIRPVDGRPVGARAGEVRAGDVGTADVRAADVRLMVQTGELPRGAADRLLRAAEPHLLVVDLEGVVRLGPLVVPGRTACLRCVDAHLGERDPRRALVVEQYATAAARPGVPEPSDPLLMTLACAFAVRDLVSYVEGDRPATWSTTVRIGPDLALERQVWPRHPACGCAWGEGLVLP